MDPLGPGGHREGVESRLGQQVADAEGHLRRRIQIHVLARIEVDHDPSCPARLVVLQGPLRHVQLERGLLGEPRERGGGVQHRVADGARGVLDRDARHPVGRVGGEVLLEEGLVVGAVGPALARHRPPSRVRHEQRGDGQEVLQHIGLGGAGGLVEHLVGVGEPDSPPVDLDRLLAALARHRSTLALRSDIGDRLRFGPRRARHFKSVLRTRQAWS